MKQIWNLYNKRERKVHIVLFLAGVFLIPCGTVLMINSHFGADGIDALDFAFAAAVHIPVSVSIYILSVVYITLAAVIRRRRPNLFYLVTILSWGLVTELWKAVFAPFAGHGFASSFGLFMLGIVVMAIGAAPYFLSLFPSMPGDDLPRAITERGVPVSIAKIIMEGGCALVAWILHGEVNIGTVIVIVLLGPLIGVFQRPVKALLARAGIRYGLEQELNQIRGK